MWATAAGFGLSALCLAALRLDVPAPEGGTGARDLWRSTREGLLFVWRNRLLRTIGLLSMLLNAIYLPIEAVVLPAHFQALDSPGRLGFLLAAMAAGGIAGALAYGAWGLNLSRRLVFLGGFVGSGVMLVGLAFLPAYPMMVGLGIAVGWCYGPVDPLINYAMQTSTPEAMRGRVYSMLTSLAFAAGPLGYVGAGALVEAFGVRAAMLALCSGLLLVALSAVPLRVLRELDDNSLAHHDASLRS